MRHPSENFRDRRIIESPRFSKELREIQKDERRADEFIESAKLVLPSNPYIGQQLVPSHIWFLPISEAVGRAALYYRFDEDVIEFLSIKALK